MDLVTYRVEHATATLTLNRPEKRNALSAAMVEALLEALSRAEDAADVRVVVLTGAGSAFSAGADLDALQRLQEASMSENLRDSRVLASLFDRLYRSPKPVIAKINGPAVAGGCGLALACDFSVAVPEALFGFPEVRIGFVPAIVMRFLRNRVGDARARLLVLTGRLVSAEAAAGMGLITQVEPEDSLDEAVEALAQEIAVKTSPSAVRLTKAWMADMEGLVLAEALDRASHLNAFARGTADCKAGVRAFLNKTDPPWSR